MIQPAQSAALGYARRCVAAFARDDSAATAVEYAVLLAITLTVVIGAISLLGIKNRDIWAAVGQAMADVM